MKKVILLSGIIIAVISCKKEKSHPKFLRFDNAGGIYDFAYRLEPNGSFYQSDSLKVKVASDGTITEYRTTSNNVWTAQLNYVEAPDSMLAFEYSYFNLTNIQSNTDPSKAKAVKVGHNGYFAKGQPDASGRYYVIWRRDTGVLSTIAVLRTQ